jgi:hypothetical protein
MRGLMLGFASVDSKKIMNELATKITGETI